MIRHIRFGLAVAFLATSTIIPTELSHAAGNDCSIRGAVKSASGQPVAGAFVKLRNADRRLTIMVISQAEGIYLADKLFPGNYVAQGIGKGFQSAWSKPLVLLSGKSAIQDLSFTDQQGPPLPRLGLAAAT